jgi:aminoacylase
VHPTPDYKGAVEFLTKIAHEYQCDDTKVIELVSGKPIAVFTWKGSDPSLPSVLLNSHTDVVPVVRSSWKCDPFEAYKDENGNIFGRGTQDMKCVCIQYMEAIGRIKKNGTKLKRTVHLMYVPDEEVGGADGMAKLVETKDFTDLNAAVVLDEGLASPTESFTVFYGERVPWWIRIKVSGPTGHGSRFIENSAVEKLLRTVNKMLAHRKEQFDELQRGMAQCGMTLGDVTTLNLTMLKTGVTSDGVNFQLNVIPTEAEAGFDIRIPPSVNLDDFKKQIEQWTSEPGMSYEFTTKPPMKHHITKTTTENEWWGVFKGTMDKGNHSIDLQVFPAATDSRFIRATGIPAFGFSPINNTPILLHDHNEFLNEKVFLKGIDIYVNIITDLANHV